MTYKQKYDVVNCGCDVIYSASSVIQAVGMISYIQSVKYRQPSGCDYTDRVGVISDAAVVLSFIHHMRCHTY